MANHCYNLIQVLGNTKAKAQMKAWIERLRGYTPTAEDPHCERAIREVFYPALSESPPPDLGSQWVHLDEESLSPSDAELAVQSAWSPPTGLVEKLACLLFSFDKNVVVRNSFNIDDGSCGVSYTAAYDSENTYSQTTVVEPDEDDDEDDPDFELEQKLNEAEISMLGDLFLDDMPHLTKVIKRHLPHLEIDWDSLG